MKNMIYTIVFLALGLNASEYYAKVEPYEIYTISSELSGKVEFIDKSKEFSFVKNKSLVLKLNSQDEEIELNSAKNSLKIQQEVLQIRQSNYANKAKVKQLSIYDKNQEKLSVLESKQSVEDLKKSIKSLENQKSKKEFFIKNRYLKEIYVHDGEYVDVGVKLFELYDFSKSKLEIYVKPLELKGLREKQIYLNGTLSTYKVQSISKVRDEKRISTYKVVLSKSNQNQNFEFGKIVKVEFK